LGVGLVAGAFYGLYLVGDLVQLIVVAALVAYLLDPLARWLEARGLSRGVAASLVFFPLVVLIVVGVFVLVPVLARQAADVQENLVRGDAAHTIAEIERYLEVRLAFAGVQELNLLSAAQSWLVERLGQVELYAPAALSVVLSVIIVPFVVFFLLRDGRQFKKAIIVLVPNAYFERTLKLLHKTDLQLGNYLRGKLIDSTIIGLAATTILWAMDVPFYALLGLVVGLTNLIPYVGPAMGGLVVVVVTFFTVGTPDTIFGVMLGIGLLQLFDNTVLQPLVLAKNVEMHPLVVALSVIIGGQFFGVLGLFLAVPVVAVGKIIAEETWGAFGRAALEVR
jgi:predicted PurR-regulated permease PerM